MTKNLDNEGLKSIVENYDFFFIDLWGVVHNGIKLYENEQKLSVKGNKQDPIEYDIKVKRNDENIQNMGKITSKYFTS